VVERTAEDVFMPLTVGGYQDDRGHPRPAECRCDKVSINTTAVKDPYFISRAAEKSEASALCRHRRKRVPVSMTEATGEDWLKDPS